MPLPWPSNCTRAYSLKEARKSSANQGLGRERDQVRGVVSWRKKSPPSAFGMKPEFQMTPARLPFPALNKADFFRYIAWSFDTRLISSSLHTNPHIDAPSRFLRRRELESAFPESVHVILRSTLLDRIGVPSFLFGTSRLVSRSGANLTPHLSDNLHRTSPTRHRLRVHQRGIPSPSIHGHQSRHLSANSTNK